MIPSQLWAHIIGALVAFSLTFLGMMPVVIPLPIIMMLLVMDLEFGKRSFGLCGTNHIYRCIVFVKSGESQGVLS